MTPRKVIKEPPVPKKLTEEQKLKTLKKADSAIQIVAKAAINPWTSVETARNATATDLSYDYREKVDLCRFFYRTEPVVSTVINKLVEIGINDLVFKKKNLPENQFRLFNALKPRLLEFAEVMAQEFFVSGLVVPSVSYGSISKEEVMEFGVKKFDSLMVPNSMFVRDPKTIKINVSLLSDTPSYYIEIPPDTIYFIVNNGKFPDGKEDTVLFDSLKAGFPEFVSAVQAGETEVQVEASDAKLTIRRKYTSDNQYPIPYVAPVLDALQHKRQLRRMDYSIIDKILSAILHVKVGNDQFPVTEADEDQDVILQLKQQLAYRFNTQQNLERIFQLLTNHTVELEWIFPNSEILLNVDKYKDINQEILFGLGFPQILITGESSRSGSSDPEIAMISPVKTMENCRRKIIKVISDICKEVATLNGYTSAPDVSFASLNLHAFAAFMQALQQAYANSSISRTSFAEALGYDFDTELAELVTEKDALDKSGLPQVGPSPFSGNVANPGNNNQNPQVDKNGQPIDNQNQPNNPAKPAPKPAKKPVPGNNAQ